jgi:hypothetical protein
MKLSLKLSLLLLATTGCALSIINRTMPERKVIVGVLVHIEQDWRYEAPCSFSARMRGSCDVPPICCAYQALVIDEQGRKHFFFFFAPKGNKIPRKGKHGRWVLHARSITRFNSCSAYGCATDMAFALDSDADYEQEGDEKGRKHDH